MAWVIRCVCTYIKKEHLFKPHASILGNDMSYVIYELCRLEVVVTGNINGSAIISSQDKKKLLLRRVSRSNIKIAVRWCTLQISQALNEEGFPQPPSRHSDTVVISICVVDENAKWSDFCVLSWINLHLHNCFMQATLKLKKTWRDQELMKVTLLLHQFIFVYNFLITGNFENTSNSVLI